MLRENEVSRVGEVLERKEAGDRAGMIASALRLWAIVDTTDGAITDVWEAMFAAGAVDDAVAAGLALVRGKTRIAPAAWIDLVEATDDPEILVELATLAIEAWPIDPYLGAVFAHMIALDEIKPLHAFIAAYGERLSDDRDGFTLVGYALVASRVGDWESVLEWFRGWIDRDLELPTWLFSAYTVAANQVIITPEEVKATRLDETAVFVRVRMLLVDLAMNRDKAFAEIVTKTPIALVASELGIDHPMLRYINGFKRAHPIGRAELEWVPRPQDPTGMPLLDVMVGIAARGVQVVTEKPPDWRTIQCLAGMMRIQQATVATAAAFFPLVATMIQTESRDVAIETYRAVRKLRPDQWKPITGSWKRLSTAKLGWFRRLRLEYE